MNSSDIIAIIALAVSVVAAAYEIYLNRKINTINLNSYYFNEIYREHLINKIPKARKYISISNNKVVGCKYMIKEMQALQSDSLYYKYMDRVYFKKLKNNAQILEEYLIECDKKMFVGEEQTDFFNNLATYLEKLYEVINEKYIK